jgi:hypothetical protein
MIGFLIVHALGNLQVFAGPLKINEYSASLRRSGRYCGSRVRADRRARTARHSPRIS